MEGDVGDRRHADDQLGVRRGGEGVRLTRASTSRGSVVNASHLQAEHIIRQFKIKALDKEIVMQISQGKLVEQKLAGTFVKVRLSFAQKFNIACTRAL